MLPSSNSASRPPSAAKGDSDKRVKHTVDGQNPFRTTFKPWEIVGVYRGNHHSRFSLVVQEFVHPQYIQSSLKRCALRRQKWKADSVLQHQVQPGKIRCSIRQGWKIQAPLICSTPKTYYSCCCPPSILLPRVARTNLQKPAIRLWPQQGLTSSPRRAPSRPPHPHPKKQTKLSTPKKDLLLCWALTALGGDQPGVLMVGVLPRCSPFRRLDCHPPKGAAETEPPFYEVLLHREILAQRRPWLAKSSSTRRVRL